MNGHRQNEQTPEENSEFLADADIQTTGKRKTHRVIKIAALSAAALFVLFAAVISLNELFGFSRDIPGWRQIAAALGLERTVYTDVDDNSAAVHFIDVGQGDCALICSDGKTVLIDSGEYDAYGAVSGYLKGLGIKHLDYAVISHPHSDHMGCMYRILSAYGAEEVIMPVLSEEMIPVTGSYTALMDVIEDRGIKVTPAVTGTCITLGRGRLDILAPVKEYEDINNSSAVVKFSFGSRSFLFCGDVEEEAERDITDSGRDISADVIKAPHHGSNSSSSKVFVQAVSPEYTVFCVGRENDYYHPHRSVVDLYRKLGVKICRTDTDGNIVFVTDGESLDLITEKGGAAG